MKTKKCIGFLLAASLLAACSDDVDMNGDGPAVETEGRGYINVAIHLPTQTGSGLRASDLSNDQFDAGDKNEYNVNNVHLVLFKGDTEAEATYAAHVDLEDKDSSFVGDKNNVTSYIHFGVKEVDLEPGQSYWGLVVVNANSKVSFDNGFKINTQNGSKLEDLINVIDNATVSDFTGTGNDQFLMLNAPLAKQAEGSNTSQEVRTLVPIKVYNSETAAEQATDQEDIFVERLVAKVTVTTSSSFTAEDGKYPVDSDGSFSGHKVTIDGWCLNVTNKSTRFVRSVPADSAKAWAGFNTAKDDMTVNRFFSSSDNALSQTDYKYRIYWGIDGNYDGSVTDNSFNVYSTPSIVEGQATEEEPKVDNQLSTSTTVHPEYCFENTFSVANMTKNQTTGVLYKMTYYFDPDQDEAATFFMLDDDNTTYTEPAATGTQDEDGDDAEKPTDIISAINQKLDNTDNIEGLVLESGYKGGYYDTVAEIQALFNKGTGEDNKLTNDEAQKILNAAGGAVKVYKNGTSYYYTSMIQHFGDTYTPYTDGETYTAQQHLGRYGVLRNNWYEIEIAGVSGPGYPEIPEPGTDEPDDEKNYYINVKVNILAWAKRKQEVHL